MGYYESPTGGDYTGSPGCRAPRLPFLCIHKLGHLDKSLTDSAAGECKGLYLLELTTLQAANIQAFLKLVSKWLKWIAETPFRFAKSPAQSDLDVALGSYGRQVLERHWDSWISESDWEWISARGFNTVRIPIGFYHICGAEPSVLQGTDFSGMYEVFQGAWSRIANALATANTYGIGVLIDLHAAPGKQNRDSHSGTSSSEPRFFTPQNMKHTVFVLTVLAKQLKRFAESHNPPLHNLVGIELLNEPVHHDSLERWYIEASNDIRQIDPSLPLYIGDSWQTDQYTGFIERQSSSIPFLVLDHHLYRCFTQEDAKTSVHQHAQNLLDPNAATPQMFARVASKLENAGGAMVVGEWSGAMNPGSLHGVGNEIEALREFVKAQLALYERHCAGYYFWTYKKETTGDKGWSLRDAVQASTFPITIGRRDGLGVLQRTINSRAARRESEKSNAYGQHVSYWSRYPGNYEHWRFEAGFLQGWDDAWTFIDFVNSSPGNGAILELGFRGPWAKRRVQQHATTRGSNALWEFEHGFKQGVLAAHNYLRELLP
ncbi:glycoside hydrolase [Panus rudis PR-1116 ss-1]|nr:glycoside hydrolase [Panus rudis PR-1116 ss-1]